MKSIQPADLDPRAAYQLLVSVVIPRPIGWISTVSAEGVYNLAPYSFFNGVGGNPPTVMFSASKRRPSDIGKDSLLNAQQTGEFVVNIVSEDLTEAMNNSSADVPFSVNEFEHVGLTA
ncbi:MAG: flavin reductase family protein, partial [Chloroflexi bacterium]|nr:flavin reductase family protein [Chloroflexota bacterium]